MEPSLNSWTIFFLVAAIQGLFLAAMIFLRRSRANNLLGGLILAFSICLIYYVTFWTNYVSILPRAIGVLQSLTYSFGPLLYFYIRSEKKSAYWNWYHFIPQALSVLFFFSRPLFTIEVSPAMRIVVPVIQCLHLLIYTLLILQFTYRNRGYSNGALKMYQWRKHLSWAFVGYTFSFISYYVLVWTGTLKIEYDYMISLAASFFIYFIGYNGFQRQEVLKMYENKRYEHSSLSPSASQAILTSLREHMEEQQPYLDSSLRLQDLAKSLNLSNHYISQVINNLEEKNFADFVNEYRIREAKKLLTTTSHKIIHIAYDCGFNNKASFNNAFKRFTGMSPSEFREQEAVIA